MACFAQMVAKKKEQLPGDNSVRRGLFRVQKLDIFQSLGCFEVTQALNLKWIATPFFVLLVGIFSGRGGKHNQKFDDTGVFNCKTFYVEVIGQQTKTF